MLTGTGTITGMETGMINILVGTIVIIGMIMTIITITEKMVKK